MQNIVSSVDFKRPLKLHEIIENTDSCSWENRKFPGLVMRDTQSKLVILIFRSGRCVITGSKSKRQLLREWPRLYKKIYKYIDYDNNNKCSRAYAAHLRRNEEKQPFDEDVYAQL